MVHCLQLYAKPGAFRSLALPISRWKVVSRVSEALCHILLFITTASGSSPISALRTIRWQRTGGWIAWGGGLDLQNWGAPFFALNWGEHACCKGLWANLGHKRVAPVVQIQPLTDPILHMLPLKDNASRTAILLHKNVLSCSVPRCGNAKVRASTVAIGNRLGHASKDEFPAWVSKYERDPLFWVSGNEGMSLLQKITGAALFFVLVMAWKLDNARWLSAMSRWQIGSGGHLWALQASSHLVSCLAKESLSAAVFVMLLLSWDIYSCPETLAMVSACIRRSALIRALVFLCWCKLTFYSLAVAPLVIEGQDRKKQWTATMLRKRFLLWLLWCALTLVLSSVAILYQVSHSIPGFLPAGKIWSLGLKACNGTIQGVVGKFIVPFLARKVASETHLLTRVSTLIMNCLIPAVIIVYLDTGCLGRWAALWEPCRRNRHWFQQSLVCPDGTLSGLLNCGTAIGDPEGVSPMPTVHTVVVRPSDICDARTSWSFTSMSRSETQKPL